MKANRLPYVAFTRKVAWCFQVVTKTRPTTVLTRRCSDVYITKVCLPNFLASQISTPSPFTQCKQASGWTTQVFW